MEEKRREAGSPSPAATLSGASSLKSGDSPANEPPPPRRRGQMRKSTTASSHSSSNAHVVPIAAGWFSWTTVHSIEKQTLRSFFNGKVENRTPEIYQEIRNWIMKKFHTNPSTNIELKDLSELSVGDLEARQEIMEFLDHWGLINYHPFLQNDPANVDADPNTDAEKAEKTDSVIEKLFQFENEQSSPDLVPRANWSAAAVPFGLFPESIAEELVKQEGPAVEYHCNSCSADCSCKRYHCQKQVASFFAIILWNILHSLVTIWYWVHYVLQMLESYLITHGFLTKYKSLDSSKVRYLAIVVETEEAHQISEVIELLKWVAVVGVKRVCLYDRKGVLKESQETIIAKCNARPWKGVETGASLKPNQMTLEFLSSSDGKEAVVKAANMLFLKFKENPEDKPKLTEPLLDEALKLVGCSGPEPDLLLIYGPVRCHLGFPAWRLRYTEIVHMGHLKSKKYGSLIKAIYRFTTIRQNYGT